MNELAKDLTESFKTGILGMGITLVALYVLSLLLDLMKVIFYKPENKEKTEVPPATVKQKELPSEEEPKKEDDEDEEELVAVITAALAAYLKKPQDQIRIGFIQRIHERTPRWGMESRLNPME